MSTAEQTTEQLTAAGVTPVIDLPALAAHFEVTTRAIVNWVDAGLFPRPKRIGRRLLRWSVPELNAWIEAGCPPVSK